MEPAIGSGPYVLDSYDINKRITYKRNPDYWGKDLPLTKGVETLTQFVLSILRIPMQRLKVSNQVLTRSDKRTRQNHGQLHMISRA